MLYPSELSDERVIVERRRQVECQQHDIAAVAKLKNDIAELLKQSRPGARYVDFIYNIPGWTLARNNPGCAVFQNNYDICEQAMDAYRRAGWRVNYKNRWIRNSIIRIYIDW